MNFNQFVEDIEKNHWEIFGVEEYLDGQLVQSYGDTNECRHDIFSATKSITSIGAGLAWDEGKVDYGKSILEYLPADIVSKMSASQKDIYRVISVKRLMTMSVKGYPFRPEGDDWLRNSLAIELPEAKTPCFDYSNIPAYLVGVAVSNALGEDLYGYLNRKLFAPLGIDNPGCTRCPGGYFYGASGMTLTVNELSRIGLMLMNGGNYNGQQILSPEYVKIATGVQQMNREGGYGFFFWKIPDGFSINGKWKQKCYVLPKEKRVVTFLGHMEQETPEFKVSLMKNMFR